MSSEGSEGPEKEEVQGGAEVVSSAGDTQSSTAKEELLSEGSGIETGKYVADDKCRGSPTDDTSSQASAAAEQEPMDTAAPVAESSSEASAEGEKEEEKIGFKVIFNKQKYDVSMPLSSTVAQLKIHLEPITKVPRGMQKIMIKGPAKDSQILKDLKVSSSTKCMMIGSTVADVMSMAAPSVEEVKAEKESARSKESLSKQKLHAKVLDKHGKPEDVTLGVKGKREALPHVPLSGMYNKYGGRVRLTFKLEADQLWIGTKERTEKIPMGSIKHVLSEAIDGNDGYHIMGLQLGPTEASRYWIYWVPAQYVSSIKDTIMGKWQQPF